MLSSPSRSATTTPETSPGRAPDADLERALGYRFVDRALLDQALTHKSSGRIHNERLEFLGDAVLGYVVADQLFRAEPGVREDELSLLRASLVRKETLAQLAKGLELGNHLRLGSGVRRSGGHRLESILADTLEAVIGAVHLDGGIEAAGALVLRLLEARMAELDPDALKDSKTRLQELLQSESLALPEYVVETTAGSAHARTFTVSCRVPDLELTAEGEGRSRRAAEKQAAERMLERISDRLGQR